MRSTLVVVVASPLLFAVGCNALSGIGDYSATDVLPQGTLPDGGTSLKDSGAGNPDGDGSTTGDGGQTVGSDGGPVEARPIEATLASCQGTGRCLPNNDGWTPVVVGQSGSDASAPCPPTWPTRLPVQFVQFEKCRCLCKADSGSCQGPVDVKTGAACGSGPSTLPTPQPSKCADTNQDLAPPIAFVARPPNPPTSCTGVISTIGGDFPDGSLCAGAALSKDIACGKDEVCAPPGGASGLRCILHDGEVPCPPAFAIQYVVGKSIDDQRTCATSCTCAPTGCTDGLLQLVGAESCNSNAPTRYVRTDGHCHENLSKFAALSLAYMPGVGCEPSSPASSAGELKVEEPQTLCCAG